MSSILESKDVVYRSIWQDLKSRFEELDQDRKWHSAQPRVAIVGLTDARPDEIFEALFGVPLGKHRHEAAEDSVWEVHATFELKDVPGFATVGSEGDEEQALSYLREADAVVLVLLRERRPTEVEQALYDHIQRLRRVKLVLVNTPVDAPPAETVEKDQEEAAWTDWELELRRVLNDPEVGFHRVRRLKSKDLVKIAKSLHQQLDGRLKLNFVASLKHHSSREALVLTMIHDTAKTAAVLGLNPIPYADVIAITPVQVLLVCRLGAVYGHRITARFAADFVAVCGAVLAGGMGFRQLYRLIKGQFQEPSLPLQMGIGSGVAWFGTELIGHAARIYFQSEGRLTPQQARAKAVNAVAEQSLLGSLLL